MNPGKVKPALRLLSASTNGKFHSLDELANPQSPGSGLVRDILKKKHPSPGPIDPSAIYAIDELSAPSTPYPHPVIFDRINGDLIKQMVRKVTVVLVPQV